MRGNLAHERVVHGLGGSIPAYAGEPPPAASAAGPGAVYPRVCGGTALWRLAQEVDRGLSPRMRGNPPRTHSLKRHARSIPAYAGEPAAARALPKSVSVYPRVCGGTQLGLEVLPVGAGLSPRMRGNPHHRPLAHRLERSIPAYAGEPAARRGVCGAATVYPRVCGEPRPAGGSSCLGAVYPRVCGGTASSMRCTTRLRGLSPRMRGNLTGITDAGGNARSIPAYAGEPGCRGAPCGRGRVYPRVCGGTATTNDCTRSA